MRLFAACFVSIAVGCGGGGSTKTETTEPKADPVVSLDQKRASTCKALCTTMGRCANDSDWDNSACAAACGKSGLSSKYLHAYDSCAAKTECTEAKSCIGKVKLAIRQEKTCNKICDRSTECVIEDAKKTMSAKKAAEHTKQKVVGENRRQCLAECMATPKTAGQIKGADICLAKKTCAEYTKCATGGDEAGGS